MKFFCRYMADRGLFGVGLDILMVVMLSIVLGAGLAMTGVLGFYTFSDFINGGLQSPWEPEERLPSEFQRPI